MSPAHPPEFRTRAIELARERARPLKQIAKDHGISPSCLPGSLKQADVDRGDREGLTTTEHAELLKLRRENRTLAMENEIFKRAAAYFAKENVLGAILYEATYGLRQHVVLRPDDHERLFEHFLELLMSGVKPVPDGQPPRSAGKEPALPNRKIDPITRLKAAVMTDTPT